MPVQNMSNSCPGRSMLMQTLERSHIVRLRGYRPRADVKDIRFGDLMASWKERQLPTGILYSEIAEHIPEWSEEAASEIDHLAPFVFLEYSVIEPEHAADEDPDFFLSQSEQLEVVEGFYTVDFRFLKESAVGEPSTLMFNLFEIDGTVEFEQAFIMNWVPRAEFRSHDEGFFSAILHQRIGRKNQFAAFNRTEFLDAASYAEGIARFEQAFPRAERGAAGRGKESANKPVVRSHLGLFKIVAKTARKPSEKLVKTMNSVRIYAFGEPSVLKYEQVPLPEPGPGQIRIAVRASAVNALDLKMRAGEVSSIFPAWFPDTLGYSVAGFIDALGAGVTNHRIGDEVYGINHPIFRGGYAEYIIGPAENYFRKPTNIDFNVAASIPSVFATAYGALFERVPLRAGQRILIHGGSGAVGSIAVQLARRLGAYVIATASIHNLERVKELGANEVIDYKNQKFEDQVSEIDFVLDTVGGETRERSWSILREGGVLATLVPPFPDMQKAASNKIAAFMVHGHSNIGEILPQLTQMIEEGELRAPAIIKTYSLENARQAHTDFAANAGNRIVLEIPSKLLSTEDVS